MDDGPFGRTEEEGDTLLGGDGEAKKGSSSEPNENNPFDFVAGKSSTSGDEPHLDDDTRGREESGEPQWAKGKVEADEALERLALKEKEIAEREAKLKQREEEQDRLAGIAEKRPNWPPCYPVVRNDIENDIPANQKSFVKYGFVCWILTDCGYGLNFFIAFLMLVTGNFGFGKFLLNCLATGGGVPLAWFCWYQALYNLAQNDAAIFPNLKFFFHFCFHVLFCGLAFLSPPIIGDFNSGLFTMIFQFSAGGGIHVFFGIMCLVNSMLWLGIALLSLWILQRAFRSFRSGGGLEATQQAGASAIIAAKASMSSYGTAQQPSAIP